MAFLQLSWGRFVKLIGIADTTFARVDMGGAAIDELTFFIFVNICTIKALYY